MSLDFITIDYLLAAGKGVNVDEMRISSVAVGEMQVFVQACPGYEGAEVLVLSLATVTCH